MKKKIRQSVSVLLSICILLAFAVPTLAAQPAPTVSAEEAAVGITKSPVYATEILSASTSIESIAFEQNHIPVEIKTTVTNGVIKKVETYHDRVLVETRIPEYTEEISIADPPFSLFRYSDKWGTWSDWQFVHETYESETLNQLAVDTVVSFMQGLGFYFAQYPPGIYDAAVRFCTAAANYGYVMGNRAEALAHIYKDRRHTVSEPYYYQSRHNTYYHIGNWNNFTNYESTEFAVAYYPY